jgi:hypothetical protein
MEEEKLQAYLDETFNRDEVLQVVSLLAPNRAEIEVRSETPALGLLSELLSAAPAISVTVGIINLVLSVTKQRREHTADTTLDFPKFKQMLETELANLGLVEWKLNSIDDFSSITDGGPRPCRIVVSTNNGELITLFVERDGRQLRFHRAGEGIQ